MAWTGNEVVSVFVKVIVDDGPAVLEEAGVVPLTVTVTVLGVQASSPAPAAPVKVAVETGEVLGLPFRVMVVNLVIVVVSASEEAAAAAATWVV